MQEPLVSIIIPTFNYGHLIAETLDCLLDQGYTNWEAIVVDDGSIDNTSEVVKSFCSRDTRIKYVYQNNLGVSSARNHGMEICNGKYIQFLDSDDLLTEKKIAIQVEYMENHEECDLSYSYAKYFRTDKPNEFYLNYHLTNQEWMPKVSGGFKEILPTFISTVMPMSCPLIRSAFLKKKSLLFDANYVMYEDWDFWLRCLYKGANFKFISDSQCLTLIRVHNSSRTNSFLMNFFNMKLRKSMLSYITAYPGDKTSMLYENKRNLIFACRGLIRGTNWFNIQGLKVCYKEMGMLFTFKAFFKELNSLRKRK